MKNCNAPKNQTTRRIPPTACATALALAFTVSRPQPAHAGQVTPPPVPDNIQVPTGNTVFLEGHGVGTQNYVCLSCPNATIPAAMCPSSGVTFTLFTPQATLFDDHDRQVTTHFFSPNLFENNTNPRVVAAGMIRATWQHSRDTSTVWAKGVPNGTAFVTPDAIPWLLLQVVGAKDGPTGGDKLAATTFIQRLNTSGGVAPSTGCIASTDVGNQAFVPYTADYFFYKAAKSNTDDGN